jgi:hypothetical protein
VFDDLFHFLYDELIHLVQSGQAEPPRETRLFVTHTGINRRSDMDPTKVSTILSLPVSASFDLPLPVSASFDLSLSLSLSLSPALCAFSSLLSSLDLTSCFSISVSICLSVHVLVVSIARDLDDSILPVTVAQLSRVCQYESIAHVVNPVNSNRVDIFLRSGGSVRCRCALSGPCNSSPPS